MTSAAVSVEVLAGVVAAFLLIWGTIAYLWWRDRGDDPAPPAPWEDG